MTSLNTEMIQQMASSIFAKEQEELRKQQEMIHSMESAEAASLKEAERQERIKAEADRIEAQLRAERALAEERARIEKEAMDAAIAAELQRLRNREPIEILQDEVASLKKTIAEMQTVGQVKMTAVVKTIPPERKFLITCPNRGAELRKEAKAEAERVAAEAENARLRAEELTRQEQAEAVKLAKSIIEDTFTRDYYGRPDKELIEIGLRLKAGLNAGPPPTYPNALLQLWRDQRYKGKIERVNMGFCVPTTPRHFDGYPVSDEADEDAKRILNTEWDRWLCYCRRFADRFGEGAVPSEQEKRINELIQENKKLQTSLNEATAKIEKSRQAFASTFA